MIRLKFRPVSGRQLYLATVMTAAVFAWSSPADALPTGFQVKAGAAALDPANNSTLLQVDQSSNRVVINWSSFNIDSGQTVKFQQPGASSIAFNVLPAGVSTTIAGELTANGGVWLFSPGGILFGPGSKVMTGSFLASTGTFKEDAASLNTAMNSNTIQIFSPTGSNASIGVDSGSGNVSDATITAENGFVLLNAQTITQDGSVSASDAVVYNADQGVTVQFLPASDNISLVNEVSPSGAPGFSGIEQSGSTTAGTWFEADAVNDHSLPGSGIINLGGLVTANGMKADTLNPADPHNGYSVILDADYAGAPSVSQSTAIDGSGGTINAASGIFAEAGTITTGMWTSTAGAMTLEAANAITIPDFTQLNSAGALDIDPNGPVDVEGQINSATSVFIAATKVTLGTDGSISAGFSEPQNGGTISTGSGTASVTLQNFATNGETPAAPAAGGNILIGAPLSWATDGSETLTLNAYNSLIVGAPITALSDSAQVSLNTAQGGSGGDYSFVNGGSLSFTGDEDSTQGLTINSQTYTLIFNQADLLKINDPSFGSDNAGFGLNGHYALAGPLDFNTANTATVFIAAPIGSLANDPFFGTFTGLGNTISNLTINADLPISQFQFESFNGDFNFTPTNGQIGLFGSVGQGGMIRDVTLVNASVIGGDGMQVGALVGHLDGTVQDAFVSGQVTAGGEGGTRFGPASADAGGLVGESYGEILNSQASVNVTAGIVDGGNAFAGGLVGSARGGSSIVGSSATGSVTVGATDGAAAPIAGGLVGQLVGFALDGDPDPASISGSYATGAVSGGDGSVLGGFAGEVAGGQVTTSYATGLVTQTSAPLSGLDNFAGGFVGELTSGGSIDQSYASGAVQTIAGTNSAVQTFAGGFAGNINSGSSVSNAYALGAVAATGGTASDVGGFAGIVETNSTVNGFYATGQVTGSGTKGGLVAVVGDGDPDSGPPDLAPRDTSSISNGYWDEGTTGQAGFGYTLLGTATTASNIVGIGAGTTRGAYDPNSYLNFGMDLTSGLGTWVMIPGETRPMLSSEYSTTITNAHQLQLMTLHLGDDYVVANDIDASETNNDPAGIWNPANGFVPVGGNGAVAFTGVFDGQGHTISNLKITFTTADPQMPIPSLTTNGVVGLFGFVGPTGVLADVNIANAHVTAGDGMLVGALAGGLLGSVNNASSSGVIKVGNEIGETAANAGGLVGGSAGSITNSHSSASVTGGDAFAGGLLGSAGDTSTVTGSFATGNVIVGNYSPSGIDSPSGGGLVGEQDGASSISGSFATGSVTGGAGSVIGGLIGSLNGGGFVTTSYATGNVIQTVGGVSGSNSAAGGFVGSDNDSLITQSYASGAVSSVAAATGSFTHAGGFAGDVSGSGASISEAYALGTVTVTDPITGLDSGGGPAGVSTAGGFAGAVYHEANVDDVYATGLVTGAADVTMAGLVAQVGSVDGPVGNQVTTGGTVSDSYWDEGTTHQMVGANLVAGTPAMATNVNPVGVGSGLSAYDPLSYANFDLTNTWYMIPGETRPILRSEYSTTITNAHQLQLMNLDLGADYTLAGNIDASETTNASGVWNPANGFVPVGDDPNAPFMGDFNGQGHLISNLTIIDATAVPQTTPFETATNGAVGLFGYLGGKAENLSIAGHATGGDGMIVGLLAGDLLNHAVVQNVTTSGTVHTGNGIDTLDDGPMAAAGGLVGANSGLILTSSSSAIVTGGQAAAGGLVGELQAGQIKLSFATGQVTVGGGGTQQIPTAGGLVGSADGESTISGSYAAGHVIAGGSSIAGGFIGQSSALIDTSYATGDVTQAANLNNNDNLAGGFVGYMFGGQITQSFSSGSVNVTGSDTPSIVGGFVGEVADGGVIMNAYATSQVTVADSSSDIAGGFAGDIDHGSVTNVLATGAVSAQGSEVAGLVGLVNTSGAITNGYWDEGPVGTAATLGIIGVQIGGATNVVGMGGTTGINAFDPATYAVAPGPDVTPGFDFATTWSPPSAGALPQLYGVSHVMLLTAKDTSIVYGNFPVYTINITGLQGGDPASVVKTLNATPVDAGIANSGYYDVAYNGAPPDSGVPPPYTLAISASGATGGSGPYRIILNAGSDAAGNAGLVAGTLTVTPASLSLSADGDKKIYDGTPGDPNVVVTGLVQGDGISVDATYAQSDVGTNIPVTINGYTVFDGNNGNNYFPATETNGFGEIDAEPIVIGATSDNRVYDGMTDSGLTPTVVVGTLYNGDNLVSASQSFASKDVLGTNKSTLDVGPFMLDLADPADYSVTTATAAGTITQATLTASLIGTVEKTYDGNTSATLSGPTQIDPIGNYKLTGAIFGTDQVVLNDPTSGTYDTRNAGSEKTVSVSNLQLSGADAANYTVNQDASAAIGIIDQATLTLTPVTQTKTYDGTTTSTVAPETDGLVTGDSISGLTQSFDNRNAGTRDLVVDANSFTINDQNGGKNYIVSIADPVQGLINQASLTLTPVTQTKTYDGTADSTVLPSVDGLVTGDSITGLSQSFDSKDAGTRSLAIDTDGLTINDQNGGANYIVTIGRPVSGLINQKALTASLVGTTQKIYDGNTSAILSGPTETNPTGGNYQLSGVIPGDDVSLNDPTSGTYDNRNAGTGKLVTVNGLKISGDDAANYTVNGAAVGAIGIITPAALTLTAVTDSRTYDGGVDSSGAPTHSALITGDTISNEVQTFGSKNVLGTGGSTLSVTGFTINDGNEGRNYTVTLVSARGTINPAPLTIAAVTDEKTYDGTTAATVIPDPVGLVGGDTIAATETFDGKNAGAHTLAVAGFTIADGNNGGNYIVTTTTAAGTIDPKALTASLVGSVSKPFDGNDSATLASGNYSLSGLVSGDVVSLNDPTSGTFDTAEAGTHKIVSVGGLALSGADAANYTVNGTAAAPIGSIIAPPQPFVINLPPTDLTTPDFDQVAAFVAGSTANNTTVVNVFPVGSQSPDQPALGDSSPITGAGNRDLWTGSDQSDKPCPPNTTCPANGGTAP